VKRAEITPAVRLLDAVVISDREGEASFQLNIPQLVLEPGETIVLLGPSGSGKSTCLELLALLRPAAQVREFLLATQEGIMDISRPVQEGKLDRLSRLRAGPIGYVPQSGGLLPFLDARRNALSSIELGGKTGDPALAKRFQWIAGILGLTEHLGKMRSELSGGQRKRVAILRGLAVPRSLLLLDEPTAGLDDELADRVMELVQALCAKEHTACITAMHDSVRAEAFGFRKLSIFQETPEKAIVAASSGLAVRTPNRVRRV